MKIYFVNYKKAEYLVKSLYSGKKDIDKMKFSDELETFFWNKLMFSPIIKRENNNLFAYKNKLVDFINDFICKVGEN